MPDRQEATDAAVAPEHRVAGRPSCVPGPAASGGRGGAAGGGGAISAVEAGDRLVEAPWAGSRADISAVRGSIYMVKYKYNHVRLLNMYLVCVQVENTLLEV